RSLAVAFNDNWDLVEERVPEQASPPPDIRQLIRPVLADLDDVCSTPCKDPGDNLRKRLDEVAEHGSLLQALSGSGEIDLLEGLHPDLAGRPSFKVGNTGRAPNFSDIKEVRARVVAIGEAIDTVRQHVGTAAAEQLASALRRFTLDAGGERRRAGELEFHDLLVLARALLRDPVHGPAVRARLHGRYQRLLLDEFQDTDPIQIELAVRIACSDPLNAEIGRVAWNEVDVDPGHLFFVGDPKQSIYRFRRADISMFLAAQKRFGNGSKDNVELTANFRTVAPAIDWVNSTFARLMSEPGGDDLPVASQPRYIPLDHTRPDPPDGPAVAVMGRREHPYKMKADDVRAEEAAEVAATVASALREGWSVDAGNHTWRPARLGDITILVPARTSLPFLEDALENVGIPFRTESSSLVYGSRAIRDLLMVLRAVDDPTNYLHIVSALRTPLMGCGDDELFLFKWERRGRWSHLADQPDSVPADDRVRVGLEYLRSLYDVRSFLAPSELLDRISRDRRAMELGFAEGRPRDVWRRIRFVIDQARAWSEATGGNLRQYLQWVNLQTAEGARVAESILPETDDDAVRIMTIHSAKGLEFPITIVSGMSTKPGGRAAPGEVVFPPTGGVAYKFGKHVRTEEWESWAPIDEQMSLHERIRLLYVACTRAQDHLVVSLHRCERRGDPSPASRTNAELLVDGMAELLEDVPDATSESGDVELVAEVALPPPLAMT
ncbi:MAG TPA: UvrD-helicase domain-containing protein, partial [Acidimicrobiales bacterium]|nr:UvrD-helicase domain-containing protein [Acidimicrobiales bacterium]